MGEDEDMENVETENIVPVLPQAALELAPRVFAWALAAGDDIGGQYS